VVSAATIELSAEQLDALATLIAAKLQACNLMPGLVDAQQLAEHLGVARSFVYSHADQLGAKRLGGKRGRLRFDASEALAAFAAASQPEQVKAKPRRRRAPAHAGSILQVRA
jgi:hypothetical protein